MSTVGTTLFPNEGSRSYFTLQNEQYTRKLAIGSSWNRISVGLIYSIETSTNAIGGLWLGIGSSANGVGVGMKNGTGSLQAMVGLGTGTFMPIWGYSSLWNSLTYASSVSGSYVTNSAIVMASIVTGSTPSGFYNGGTGLMYIPTHEAPSRKVFGVILKCDRTKIYCDALGSYLGKCDDHAHSDATAYSAMNFSVFSNAITIDGVPQNVVPGFYNVNVNMAPINDAATPLDTINVFWTGSCPIRIYNILVHRYS